MKTHRKGFTTTELVVVLVLLAVVFLLVVPAINTQREKRNRVACAGNLRTIGVALFAYAADHQGCLPTIQDNAKGAPWDSALVNGRYLSVPVLQCPSDKYRRRLGEFPRTYAISYCVQGFRLGSPVFSNRSEVVLAGERILDNSGKCVPGIVGGIYTRYCNKTMLVSAHYFIPDGTIPSAYIKRSNYLFLDGHVTWVEPGDLILNTMFPSKPDSASSF